MYLRGRLLLSKISHKPFWKFCIILCRILAEFAATSSVMFSFKSSAFPFRFSYSLLLRYPQRKKSQAMKSCDLAGHSIFPVSEVMRAGTTSLRTYTAFPAVWVSAPILLRANSPDFSMKSTLPVPGICEASRCSMLNLLSLPCLRRRQRNKDWSTQTWLHHIKQ